MYAKKRNPRKLIVLVMLLALIVGGAVGGTFAWLITQSNTVTNTFTEGNVSISMKEHALNPQTGERLGDDVWIESDTIGAPIAQEVELLPGRTIYKDPTVVVEAGSEPCYVRMYMIIDYKDGVERSNVGYDAIRNWIAFTPKWCGKTTAWTDKYSGIYGHVIEFNYPDKVTTPRDLEPLFSSITIPAEWSGDDFKCLEEVKFTFIAQAVQEREGVEPFDGIEYPNITLSMNDGDVLTLAELIERNGRNASDPEG